ncbi:hypothetical protein D3C75_1302330 [compost metagenome]
MRGGLQYHDAFDMTPVERDLMNDFVSERIEQELKSPHPNYEKTRQLAGFFIYTRTRLILEVSVLRRSLESGTWPAFQP